MRKRIASIWWSPAAQGTPALVVTAAFFTLGGLVGYFFAVRTAAAGTESLRSYLDYFLSAVQAGTLAQPLPAQLLWRAFRWPLAALMLGFTALGVLGLPVLIALRGFFLSFSIVSFALAYGRTGLLIAFFLLGIPAIVAIPALFVLTTQSLSAAYALAAQRTGQGKRTLPYGQDYLLHCALCAVAVCAAILLERFLTPVLLAGTVGVFAR